MTQISFCKFVICAQKVTQKHLFMRFYKIAVLKNFAKFTAIDCDGAFCSTLSQEEFCELFQSSFLKSQPQESVFLLRCYISGPHLVIRLSLREKCQYLEFFQSVFSRIRTEYGPEKLRIRTPFTQCIQFSKTLRFSKVTASKL